MRSMTWFVAGAVLLLAASAWGLEGVEKIDSVWNQTIADSEYTIAPVDTGDGLSPEGIYGATFLDNMARAHWTWVRALAQDNSTIWCWYHTSWSGTGLYPYYGNGYDLNDNNLPYARIPMHHKYYMSGFRWNPAVIESPAKIKWDEPPNPGAQEAIASTVYLTPYAYGFNQGEVGSQYVAIVLTNALAW